MALDRAIRSRGKPVNSKVFCFHKLFHRESVYQGWSGLVRKGA
jgi:hypothetical protein